MKTNIFTKVKANPIPFAGAFVVLLIVLYSSFNAYQNYRFNKEIDNRQAASQTHVTAAANDEKKADGFEVTRSIEDGVREQVITPKLETARQKSVQSKQSIEAARRKYTNEKTNISNLTNSMSDNCRELAGLFTNVRFDDCTGAK